MSSFKKLRLIKFLVRLFFLVCYSVNVFLCCLISDQYLRPVSQAGIFSQAGLSLGRLLLSPAASCGLLSLSWPAGAGSFRFHLFRGRRRIRVLSRPSALAGWLRVDVVGVGVGGGQLSGVRINVVVGRFRRGHFPAFAHCRRRRRRRRRRRKIWTDEYSDFALVCYVLVSLLQFGCICCCCCCCCCCCIICC